MFTGHVLNKIIFLDVPTEIKTQMRKKFSRRFLIDKLPISSNQFCITENHFKITSHLFWNLHFLVCRCGRSNACRREPLAQKPTYALKSNMHNAISSGAIWPSVIQGHLYAYKAEPMFKSQNSEARKRRRLLKRGNVTFHRTRTTSTRAQRTLPQLLCSSAPH